MVILESTEISFKVVFDKCYFLVCWENGIPRHVDLL